MAGCYTCDLVRYYLKVVEDCCEISGAHVVQAYSNMGLVIDL